MEKESYHHKEGGNTPCIHRKLQESESQCLMYKNLDFALPILDEHVTTRPGPHQPSLLRASPTCHSETVNQVIILEPLTPLSS